MAEAPPDCRHSALELSAFSNASKLFDAAFSRIYDASLRVELYQAVSRRRVPFVAAPRALGTTWLRRERVAVASRQAQHAPRRVSSRESDELQTDEDWEDLWRYLEILVGEGGFVVWDQQGPNVVDLAAGPSGDGTRRKRPLLLGEREEARRIVKRELARANPEFAETVRAWGRRQGLIA